MVAKTRWYFIKALMWSGFWAVLLASLALGYSLSFAPLLIIGPAVPFVLACVVFALAQARAKGASKGTVIAARVVLGVMIAEVALSVLAVFTPFMFFGLIAGPTIALLFIGLSGVERDLSAAALPPPSAYDLIYPAPAP